MVFFKPPKAVDAWTIVVVYGILNSSYNNTVDSIHLRLFHIVYMVSFQSQKRYISFCLRDIFFL